MTIETIELNGQIAQLKRELDAEKSISRGVAEHRNRLQRELAVEKSLLEGVCEQRDSLLLQVNSERQLRIGLQRELAELREEAVHLVPREQLTAERERAENIEQVRCEALESWATDVRKLTERAEKAEQARIHVAKAAGGYLDRAEKAEADQSALLEFIHGLSDEFKLSSHFPHPMVQRWGELYAADALLTEMRLLKASVASSETALRIAREERDTQAAGAAALREALIEIETIAGNGPFSHPQRDPFDEIRTRVHTALASTAAGSEMLERLNELEDIVANTLGPLEQSMKDTIAGAPLHELGDVTRIWQLEERITQLEAALERISREPQNWQINVGSYAGGETNAGFARRLQDMARAALAAPVAHEASAKETKP